MSDAINEDSTIDVACPCCEKLLPRRGTKGQFIGFHSYVCPYCSEDFDVVIEEA